jgi:hypothetical protein
MKQLKSIVYEFTDNEGGLLKKSKELSLKRHFNKDQTRVILKLLNLLLYTEFLSIETRYYLRNRYITMRGVVEVMNEKGIETTDNMVRGRVWYDKKRIEDRIGARVLLEVVEYGENINEYEGKLNRLLEEYSTYSRLKESLAIELPDVEWRDEVDEDNFKDCIQYLAPYSKTHMKFVQENIPSECVGYIKYLLGHHEDVLEPIDLERRRVVEAFIVNREG